MPFLGRRRANTGGSLEIRTLKDFFWLIVETEKPLDNVEKTPC